MLELFDRTLQSRGGFNVTAAFDVKTGSGTYRQVVERYAYTPYGEVTFLDADFSVDGDQLSDIDNYHLYTGRERDPETGLQLNRRRWYHALLGRWVSWDPIGYEVRQQNLYEYVTSSPTNAVDPSGLVKWGDFCEGFFILLHEIAPGKVAKKFRKPDPCKDYKDHDEYAKAKCIIPCGAAGCTPDIVTDVRKIADGIGYKEGFGYLTAEHSAIRHCITVGLLAKRCKSCKCPLCANEKRDWWQWKCGKDQGKRDYDRAVSAGNAGADCAGCDDPYLNFTGQWKTEKEIIDCCLRKFHNGKIDLGK